MTANHWILLILVLWVVPSTGLICHKCSCTPSDVAACDCGGVENTNDGSHCTIVEDLHLSNPSIELGTAPDTSSYLKIKDPYYILVDEAIYRNETDGAWATKATRVVHGCDWDYCNKFDLIASLPDSFQLRIDEAWLNENIYGTGTTTECRVCPNDICGNDTQPIDYELCPSITCDNSTTCALSNLWHDVDTNELCYYSQCTPPTMVDEFSDADEKYKVQVEAIVYLAQNRSSFDIWQLSVNCAADNCTRPSIFQEIKQKLDGDVSSVIDFPTTRPSTTVSPASTTSTPPAHPLRCYNCSCIGTVCPCTTYDVSSADNSYCTIVRQNFGQFTAIDYGHVDINSTYVYIREYPYVLVEESIIYDERTGRWNTRPDIVVYGCNTDLCNAPTLLFYLPNSFQMRLPETWLNDSVLGTGQPVRECHECPDAPQCGTEEFLDPARCPPRACNTTCLVSDTFNDPEKGELCYQSFCAPDDSEFFQIDTHRVEIEGIIYASRPKSVELWEIDIFCRADDCSRPELFKELRQYLVVQPGDLAPLFNQTSGGRQLRCFDCNCEGEQDCMCDTVSAESAGSTYCAIIRNYDGVSPYVYFTHLDLSESYANVRELPYVIVKETIFQDNTTGTWSTRTDEIIYGCNWDYCNKLSLLPLLPTSLQMTLPDAWLNANLIGTEPSTLTCNDCAGSPVCAVGSVADVSSCPVQPCNSSCYVSNTFTNPDANEQCYNSYCASLNPELNVDAYHLEIEAILYPSRPSTPELWEVYFTCQAENCSRPEIFQEINQQLTITSGDLATLFNNTAVGEPGQLHCYDCFCVDDPVCACNKTIALPDNATYCTIIRAYDGQELSIFLEHIDRNSTRVYIREFPYMLVEESILYNEVTGTWSTRPNLIVYGCNSDFCNDPRLIPSLPTDFQMRLPESWLNSSILGTGLPMRDCHECPEGPQCGPLDFIDAGRCPIKSCNTTCLVFDTFDDPAVNEQCYQSFCAPPDTDEYEIDTHRIEIEGIIYGNRPNAQVDLWEVDIYCRADDCSRPEIFKELKAQLTVETGDLSAFFNMTNSATTTTTTTTPTTTAPPQEPPLACYECACIDDSNCNCTTVKISGAYSSYCTIVRVNYENHFTIDLEHIDRNSTRVYIRKFPYLLAEESILYDESTQKWGVRTNLIVYGCNTSLCNHPSRVQLLPNSFKMMLSDEWLDKNVRGSGQSVRECHECPDAPQCGTEQFIDASRCPPKACNSTCLVSDTFNNPDDNLLCYQSYCIPPEFDFEEDQHRVELEGIIYKDTPNVVELWEIDIYCRADDCSRPEIFNELRGNLTTETNGLTELFNDTLKPIEPQRICYDCFCYDDPECACDTVSIVDAASSYCIIIRDNFGDDFAINLQHIDRNSTRVYVRTFPYIIVEESILYNNLTLGWDTRTNIVVYGCNWDYCNHPKYVPNLPDSFQMRLPDAWLNTNVLGTGQPVRDCHECPDTAQCGTLDFLDASRCPVQSCNTTCLVSDLFSDPASNEQCYQSFCAPPDSEFFTIDPHRVEMEGILYLDTAGRPVELLEIDVFCRGDDCSRPTIFNEIREQFTVTLGNLSIFIPDTTTTTTGSSTITTTTRSSTSTATGTPPTGTTTTSTGSPITTTTSGSTTSPTGPFTATSPSTTRTPTSASTTSGASINMAQGFLVVFFLVMSGIYVF